MTWAFENVQELQIIDNSIHTDTGSPDKNRRSAGGLNETVFNVYGAFAIIHRHALRG